MAHYNCHRIPFLCLLLTSRFPTFFTLVISAFLSGVTEFYCPSFLSLQVCTLTRACVTSSSSTSAASTVCRSCTTCARPSARRPAAPTRRATPTRRTRAAFPPTACRGCCWDNTERPTLPLLGVLLLFILLLLLHARTGCWDLTLYMPLPCLCT